ncbi:MAG TPA: flagellar biosynthetic protein FliO [Dermatophilaceae bacterium]|nr:flagellar biosynthetic protein FliO [Dermatophilaceae bacterium]
MSDGSSVILFLRMVLSLVIVLAILVVLIRYLQRKQGVAGPRGAGRAPVPMRVVARQSLSRGTSIQVVQVGRQTLVVGVSDNGVNLLRELPADVVVGEAVVGETVPGELGEDITRAEPSKAQSLVQNAFDTVLTRVVDRQSAQAQTLRGEVLQSRGGRHRG